MGSCFSRTSLPIYMPRLVMQILDWRTESSFCGVYYGYGPDRVPPYGLKVVRNATDQDQDLRMDSNFDCYCCATTTALTLRKQGEDLIFAQIENSGAVLGTRGENNALFPVRLTPNLKPHHLPAAGKCRVEPEVVTPPYVFAPSISLRRITDEDEFVVLATGVVWEVLSNEDVVTIVGTCPRRLDAARAVVDAAVREWRHKYPALEVDDDCAVVCLFLNSTTNSTPHPLPQP